MCMICDIMLGEKPTPSKDQTDSFHNILETIEGEISELKTTHITAINTRSLIEGMRQVGEFDKAQNFLLEAAKEIEDRRVRFINELNEERVKIQSILERYKEVVKAEGQSLDA